MCVEQTERRFSLLGGQYGIMGYSRTEIDLCDNGFTNRSSIESGNQRVAGEPIVDMENHVNNFCLPLMLVYWCHWGRSNGSYSERGDWNFEAELFLQPLVNRHHNFVLTPTAAWFSG